MLENGNKIKDRKTETPDEHSRMLSFKPQNEHPKSASIRSESGFPEGSYVGVLTLHTQMSPRSTTFTSVVQMIVLVFILIKFSCQCSLIIASRFLCFSWF